MVGKTSVTGSSSRLKRDLMHAWSMASSNLWSRESSVRVEEEKSQSMEVQAPNSPSYQMIYPVKLTPGVGATCRRTIVIALKHGKLYLSVKLRSVYVFGGHRCLQQQVSSKHSSSGNSEPPGYSQRKTQGRLTETSPLSLSCFLSGLRMNDHLWKEQHDREQRLARLPSEKVHS